ncbi:MAG: PQQ-dependent sugar dehydrogenase [Planctomycetota bacterium]
MANSDCPPSSTSCRLTLSLTVVASLLLVTPSESRAQLSDPIPGAITKQGLRVQVGDFAQLPNTTNSLGSKPTSAASSAARINFLREAPDGRLFVNDLRGQLYTIDRQTGAQQTYLDIDAANGGASSLLPDAWFSGGLAAGLISFEFHPEFETNGLFYTIHTERDQDAAVSPGFETIDERGPGFGTRWHTVITEWDAANPAATAWNESTGTRRELLRVGSTANTYFHPFGDLQFNPTSQPGDQDYGLLYVSGGDWGYINGAGAPQGSDAAGQPGQLQRLDTLAGTMLRIDPRSPAESGGVGSPRGDFTVPASNPFVDGNPDTFDEIYAFGFRNGHRMAWDDDGTLFVSNIGSANIEEVERVTAGGNYGWTDREGTFINGASDGDSDNVFPVNLTPQQDVDFRGDPYQYPAVQYDHDEGFAIAGGFVYKGSLAPALQGKFVFGDIVNGRLFAADVAQMKSLDLTDPTTTAGVEEIQLFTRDSEGVEVDIDFRPDVFPSGRVDLRFGQTQDGEIWLLTKTDGFIRRLVGGGSVAGLELVVDRGTGGVVLRNASDGPIEIDGYTVGSALGALDPTNGAWDSLQDQAFPGWEEANATATALSELLSVGGFSIASGAQVPLGTAYASTQTAFGEFALDVTLEYRTADGQIAEGTVLYQGEVLSNNLTLRVDPATGQAALVNDSEFPVTITGYSVLSDAGDLTPADVRWQSLSDQGEAEWDEAAPTAFALSELAPDGASLAPGEAYDLGLIASSGADDLALEFLVDGETAPRAGRVLYELRGDFNRDGIVDAADYTVWRDSLGGSGAADGSGSVAGVPDGVVDEGDYLLWAQHFGNQNPFALAGTLTPEPTCSVLCVAALLVTWCGSRRRSLV